MKIRAWLASAALLAAFLVGCAPDGPGGGSASPPAVSPAPAASEAAPEVTPSPEASAEASETESGEEDTDPLPSETPPPLYDY